MEDMSAFFDKVVALSKQTTSMTDKEAAVQAFIECNCDDSLPALPSRRVNAGRSGQVVGSTQLAASRTDVRVVPYLAATPTRPPSSTSTNIFANRALHLEAATTLGGLAARRSGFSTAMVQGSIEESTKLFEAYVDEFNAPHWAYISGGRTEVQHSNSDHSQFTRDLVAIVTQQMNIINADQAAIDAAGGAVTTLAALHSNSADNRSSKTLYSTIGISGEPAKREPLYYGIFYMTLEMEHQVNGKSKVVSNNASTYSLLYQLDNNVLVQNAQLYNTLTRTEVDEWFANLEIY